MATTCPEFTLQTITIKMGFKEQIEDDIAENQAGLDIDFKLIEYKILTKMLYKTKK